MKKVISSCLASIVFTGAASAQLTSLFEYRFPASYDGTATADASPVLDLSDAGTNAKAYASDGSSSLILSNDVPEGAPTGARSLDFRTLTGSIRTDAGNILSRAQVIEHGGFTFDVWFKGLPGDTPTTRAAQKLIDNGGYEFISVSNHDGDGDGRRGEVFIRLSTTGNSWSLDHDDGLKHDDWNHVTYAFSVKDASNPASIVGDVIVVLNGVVTSFTDKILTATSETNNSTPRPVAIGRHPLNSGEYYQGLVYSPSIHYGVAPIAEPIALLASNSAEGFTVTIKDGSASPVNTNSVALKLNGTALNTDLSTTREGDTVTTSYTPVNGVPGGVNTVELIYQNQAGIAYNNTFTFTIIGNSEATLLKYTFPESYAGDEDPIVTDQGTAENNGYIHNFSEPLVLSDDTPLGAPTTARSLDLSTFSGSIRTDEFKLLNNRTIIAHGGFTLDVWFKGLPQSTANTYQKLIDYAGTQFIGVSGYNYDNDNSPGEVVARLGATTNTYRLDADDGLQPEGWNHLTMAYTVTNAANLEALVGNVTFTLNGKKTTYNNQTLSSAGDNLNRAIAIGAHPDTGNEAYAGLIYAPTVTLGVPVSETPSFTFQASKTAGLIMTLIDSASVLIEPSSLTLTMDGTVISGSWDSSGGQHYLEHVPSTPFTTGRHHITLSYQDTEGKTYYEARSFNILGHNFTPVFEYHFPESYAGATPQGDVYDLGVLGHNAKAHGLDATTPLPLSSDIPEGESGEYQSLDFTTTGGNILTNQINLLNRPLVIVHGGYTYDVWFKGIPVSGTAAQKIIDYAGTEHITVRNGIEDDPEAGEVQIHIDNVHRMTLDHTAGLDPLGWNHLVVSFEVIDELNPNSLFGNLIATLNEVETRLDGTTLPARGDTFFRPIGIGSHPTGGEKYTGLIYKPSVYYGVPSGNVVPPDEASISIETNGANAIITFEGVLQSSDDLTNFLPVIGATSPYTAPLSGTRFFRAVPANP